MSFKKLSFLSFLFLLVSFLLVKSAAAQTTGINLTLAPTFISLHTDPGKEVNSKFTVKNNSNVTENLQLSLVQFQGSASSSRGLSLKDVDKNDPFVKWVKFSDEEFSLAPNQQKTISVTVSPPQEAALGYYYGILVSRKTESGSGNGAVVSGAPAIPLLLEVRSPNAKKEMQLVSFLTDSFFYEYLPTNFQVKIKNTGNVFGVASGTIFIDSLAKKQIATINVNEGKGNILPSSDRTFDAAWAEGFAVRTPKTENGKTVLDSKGKPVYETHFDFSKADKFRIGRYTAHLLMVYDNGERDIPLEATVSFWVIPWKILTAGFIVLVLVLIGLRSTVLSNVQRIKRLLGK
ncbi:MAG: hypothetical protein ACM3IJ_04410 [Candidatus Levyibacteriota bacterium]